MKIYRTSRKSSAPPSRAEYPCLLLIPDNWNDYGYATLFRIIGLRAKDAGFLDSTVKILKRNPDNPREALTRTPIPEEIDDLPDDYCSLGQDIKFYEQLRASGEELAETTLGALRDVAFFTEIRNEFELVY